MLLIIKKKMIIPLEIHTLFYTLSRGLALAKKSSIISRLRKKWMAQGLKSISMELSCAFSSPIFCPQRPPKVCSVAGRENCKKMEKEISLDVWLYHLLTKTHFGFGQSQKIRFSIDLNFSFVSSIVIVKLTQSDKINSKLGLLAQSYSNRKYYVLYGITFLFGFKLNMGKAASFVCLSKREKKGHVLWSKITLHKPKRKIVKKSGM